VIDDSKGRGRRGGRNRGRGGQGGNRQQPRVVIEGLPDDDELDAEIAALEARLAAERNAPVIPAEVTPAPAAKSASTKSTSTKAAPAKAAPAKSTPAPRRAVAAKRVPPQTPPPIDVVKTGSVDKHLADDEPVGREIVSAPISFNDLDEIPEFDDD